MHIKEIPNLIPAIISVAGMLVAATGIYYGIKSELAGAKDSMDDFDRRVIEISNKIEKKHNHTLSEILKTEKKILDRFSRARSQIDHDIEKLENRSDRYRKDFNELDYEFQRINNRLSELDANLRVLEVRFKHGMDLINDLEKYKKYYKKKDD